MWRFDVKPDRVPEFIQHYGPDGTWARFFHLSPQFVRVDLLRKGTQFLTLDWWQSQADHQEFELKHRDEYRRIDRALEDLTVREERVGDFEG